MPTNRIHVKVLAVLIVYIASFIVFDVYGLDAIFSKYKLDLKNSIPDSPQYYLELLAVWSVKALAYWGLGVFVSKTYFRKSDSSKTLKNKNTILAWSVTAFIFFAVVLYGISRVWFVTPHSDLLGMLFYLSMFGLFMRSIQLVVQSYNLWKLYKLAMIVNIFPVILSTGTVWIFIFGVQNDLFMAILSALWISNVGFIYLDVANPVLIIFIAQYIAKNIFQDNAALLNDQK